MSRKKTSEFLSPESVGDIMIAMGVKYDDQEKILYEFNKEKGFNLQISSEPNSNQKEQLKIYINNHGKRGVNLLFYILILPSQYLS